ncbi:MAG: hypothetical protein ACFFCW_04560 [Candidatus Hodarchaeota archaeon]
MSTKTLITKRANYFRPNPVRPVPIESAEADIAIPTIFTPPGKAQASLSFYLKPFEGAKYQ